MWISGVLRFVGLNFLLWCFKIVIFYQVFFNRVHTVALIHILKLIWHVVRVRYLTWLYHWGNLFLIREHFRHLLIVKFTLVKWVLISDNSTKARLSYRFNNCELFTFIILSSIGKLSLYDIRFQLDLSSLGIGRIFIILEFFVRVIIFNCGFKFPVHLIIKLFYSMSRTQKL